MEFDDNSKFNPFDGPKKQRFPLTKIRPQANNNPFQFHRNDYSELSFKTTIKSKPRPKHYPQLEINPFEGQGRVPFKKEEDTVPRVRQGLKNDRSILKNKRSDDDKDDNEKFLRPNINIYYIGDSSFINNSPFQNRNIHRQKESNKKEKEEKGNESIFNSDLKKNEKEIGNNNLIDNAAPAPAWEPLPPNENDLLNNLDEHFGKMKLNDMIENPFNIILSKKKENDERIYPNNEEEHLGDYYID